MNKSTITDQINLKADEKNERLQLLFVAPMSFVSGVMTGLVVAASGYWLRGIGLSMAVTTFNNIARIPNALRLLWTPYFDIIDFSRIPRALGFKNSKFLQRKTAIVLCTLFCSFFAIICALIDPRNHLVLFLTMLTITNFWHINADLIMNSYNIETLRPKSMGISTAGYRAGIFAGGSLCLWLNRRLNVSWSSLFIAAGIGTLLIILLVVAFSPREIERKTKNFKESFADPILDLIKRYKYGFIGLILFFILYRCQEKMFVTIRPHFLNNDARLSVDENFIVNLIATFMLGFASVRSNSILDKNGYAKSFIIASFIAVAPLAGYYFYTFHTWWAYAICIVGGILFFALIQKIASKKSGFNFVQTGLVSILIGYVIFQMQGNWLIKIIAILSMISIEKMVSGIKNSILYSYRANLCSKDHVVAQLSIFESLESVFSVALQALSGFIFDAFCGGQWSSFLIINLMAALLPVVFLIATRNKIVRNS